MLWIPNGSVLSRRFHWVPQHMLPCRCKGKYVNFGLKIIHFIFCYVMFYLTNIVILTKWVNAVMKVYLTESDTTLYYLHLFIVCFDVPTLLNRRNVSSTVTEHNISFLSLCKENNRLFVMLALVTTHDNFLFLKPI